MEDLKCNYVVFHLPEDKPLKVVIRGLPLELPIGDIQNNLIERGFPVTAIHQFRKGPNRSPLPLFQITLRKDAAGKRIFNIHDILDIPVQVEQPNPKGICCNVLTASDAVTRRKIAGPKESASSMQATSSLLIALTETMTKANRNLNAHVVAVRIRSTGPDALAVHNCTK